MSYAVEFTYDGSKISVEGGALEISKDASGLKLKFNRTPSSAWSTAGRKVGSDFGVKIDDAESLRHSNSYALTTPSATEEKRPEWLLDGKRELNDWDRDPHWYKGTYSNGYTVKNSVDRAYDHVLYNNWESHSIQYRQRKTGDLKKVIRAMIVNGAGRDNVYKLAGAIATDCRKGIVKTSKDRTATDILNMAAYMNGYLNAPVKL